MSDVLLVEKLEGRIALLTVNRPDKMNALNGEVRDALFDAFRSLASDDDAVSYTHLRAHETILPISYAVF